MSSSPSLSSRSVVAVAGGVAVFAYAALVVGDAFLGVFAGATVAAGLALLFDVAERGVPPSLGYRWTLALIAGVVSFLAVGVVTQRPLRTLAFAPLLVVLAWGVARFRVVGYPDSLGRRRTLATGSLAAGLVAYGARSGATAFLVGLTAAVVVALGSWLTSPTGPLRA